MATMNPKDKVTRLETKATVIASAKVAEAAKKDLDVQDPAEDQAQAIIGFDWCGGQDDQATEECAADEGNADNREDC